MPLSTFSGPSGTGLAPWVRWRATAAAMRSASATIASRRCVHAAFTCRRIVLNRSAGKYVPAKNGLSVSGSRNTDIGQPPLRLISWVAVM